MSSPAAVIPHQRRGMPRRQSAPAATRSNTAETSSAPADVPNAGTGRENVAGENSAAGPTGARSSVQAATSRTPQRHRPAGAVSNKSVSSNARPSLASHAVCASAASLASPWEGGIVSTEKSVSPAAGGTKKRAGSTASPGRGSHAVCASAASLASPWEGGIVSTEKSVSPAAHWLPGGGGGGGSADKPRARGAPRPRG